MSGGGSYGGGDDGGGSTPDRGISCDRLRIQTTLNSPDPAVIQHLMINEELELVQKTTDGPLLAITKNKKVAGSIAGADLLHLLRCMEEGHSYKAVVKKVTGGKVEVEVSHK